MIDVHAHGCHRCGAELPALQPDLFGDAALCLDCVMGQRIAAMLRDLPADGTVAWGHLTGGEQSIVRTARVAYDRTGTLSDGLFRSLETCWRKYH